MVSIRRILSDPIKFETPYTIYDRWGDMLRDIVRAVEARLRPAPLLYQIVSWALGNPISLTSNPFPDSHKTDIIFS